MAVSADHPSPVSSISEHSVPTAVDKSQAAGVGLRSVTKKYGPVTAIENLTLDIPAGVYCCLLGPSGCGKTTALRVISGHEAVTSGQVMIGDRIVNDLPAAKRNTAMMFQNYALFPHKTIWQNVEFGLKMQRIPKPERQQRVGEMLDLVGLADTAKRKPDMLSGGQQRIALARALVTRPQVLMLDEPLSALDENLRVRMRGELRKIQKQFGLTFIQVTHHVEEAFSLSDRVVVMDHGHIDQVATPQALFEAPASQFVAKFIGDNNIFQGQVVSQQATADPNKQLIELAIPHIGSVFALGHSCQIGQTAACSVRPDLVELSATDGEATDGRARSSPQSNTDMPLNQLQARITQVELTGYVTRVSLLAEATGQPLLHNLRTVDWNQLDLQEGDRVSLSWPATHCVFLPH